MVALFILFALAAPNRFQFEGNVIEGNITLQTVHLPSGAMPVRLETGGGRELSVVLADQTGHFTFRGIRAGIYYVRVAIDGFREASQRINVPGTGPLLMFLVPETDLPPPDKGDEYGGTQIVDVRELAIPKEAVREYEKALDDLDDEDAAAAVEHLERAVKIAPDFYEAHATLATQYLNSGRAGKAEDEWTKAAEIRSHDAVPLIELGRLSMQRQDLPAALQLFERAQRRDPRSSAAVYYLAEALYETSDYGKAEMLLTGFLYRYPGVGPLQLMLANVFIKQHRLQEAVGEIDAYLEQHPDDRDRVAAMRTRSELMDYLLTVDR